MGFPCSGPDECEPALGNRVQEDRDRGALEAVIGGMPHRSGTRWGYCRAGSAGTPTGTQSLSYGILWTPSPHYAEATASLMWLTWEYSHFDGRAYIDHDLHALIWALPRDSRLWMRCSAARPTVPSERPWASGVRRCATLTCWPPCLAHLQER